MANGQHPVIPGWPEVSVVIPTYRDWHRLKACLEALATQTLPADRYNVVVVNNDPSDPCPYSLPASNMRVIAEGRPGSYAARNAGIRASRSGIVVFTDSDCLPDSNWLEEGVRCLQQDRVMLVGGQVRFMMERPVSASALLEAAGYLDNEDTIRKHGCAVTANLFVRRAVFEAIGDFDRSVMSGGDITFTRQATSKGFLLVYCNKALVWHPARELFQNLRKTFRVGKGLPAVELSRAISSWRKFVMLVLHMVPIIHPRRIRRAMKRYSVQQSGFFGLALLLSVVLGLVKDGGIIAGLASLVWSSVFKQKRL